MVALTSAAIHFEKCGAEGGSPKDADFRARTASDSTSAAANDVSSSQPSAAITGDQPLDARSAAPERARRKVSFGGAEDIEEQPHAASRVVPALVETPMLQNAGATTIDADLKVFCVHCGKQVPSEILTTGTCFCTYCGQRHPENLLSWARRSQTVPRAAEVISMADSESQIEMQVHCRQPQHWHTVAPLEHQVAHGHQGCQQRPARSQRHHSGPWQTSKPAYVNFSQQAF